MNIRGLTSAQVLQSRKKNGANILPAPKMKTVWNFLGEVFSDKLNLILLFLAFVFIVVAILGLGSITEAIGIIVVLVLISIINVATGMRSQRQMRALQEMAGIRFCNVIRDGKIHNINVTDVVVGDTVMLNTGDTICGDGYLIDGEIDVDNSVLNGETKPAHKTVIRGYKYVASRKITGATYLDKNSLFAGTTILSGRGIMTVCRVGANTENGKIMSAMRDIVAPKTSLDIQLDNLATTISKWGLIGAVVVGIVLLGVEISANGGLINFISTGTLNIIATVLSVLVITLTIIAAAVPEGLPLIVSLIISQNAREMVRHNVLAKHANKIPEAGNLQILCTDKTGTLTVANLMPIQNFLGDGTTIAFDKDCIISDIFKHNIILNGGASYDKDGKISGGNATGRALLKLIPAKSKFLSDVRAKHILFELPFDSANKYSATTIGTKSNAKTYVMGAPEQILAHTKCYMDIHGKTHKINKKIIDKIMQENATRAMRMVATAFCTRPINNSKLPNDLILVCITSLRDDIRPGVPNAVNTMHNAGVQVIMVTGDSLETATAIARETNIITDKSDVAILATDIDEMSDAELLRLLPRLRVVARAVPSTKLRLVSVAQSINKSIGMCGDGTNDAPALKLADVGFAMGSGTDVAKVAGDIIITDDNFVSITDAVMFGRTFLHNIRMFLEFQLPINVWLMLVCLAFPLVMGEPAFWAAQILIINIVMDSLNSLAFGGEVAKEIYMTQNPEQKGAPLVSRSAMGQIVLTIVWFAVLFGITYLPCVHRYFTAPGEMETVRFVILVFAAMLNGFNIRTTGYNIFRDLSRNPMFWIITIIVFAGTVGIVQLGGAMFHFAPLSITQWMILFGVSLVVWPLGWLSKVVTLKR